MFLQGIYTLNSTLASHCTFWLVSRSDDRRGSSRAPGSGQDVTGPDIDLNFQDTHFGSGTGPRSCYVAMDRCPTEEQAPAGELAGCAALGTHEACQCPSGGPGCPALLRVWTGRNTGSTCHECHSGKQESADRPRHCISGLHALALVCTRTALRCPSPGLAARDGQKSCKGKECSESAGTFRNT
jgi:hypothetical protein